MVARWLFALEFSCSACHQKRQNARKCKTNGCTCFLLGTSTSNMVLWYLVCGDSGFGWDPAPAPGWWIIGIRQQPGDTGTMSGTLTAGARDFIMSFHLSSQRCPRNICFWKLLNISEYINLSLSLIPVQRRVRLQQEASGAPLAAKGRKRRGKEIFSTAAAIEQHKFAPSRSAFGDRGAFR